VVKQKARFAKENIMASDLKDMVGYSRRKDFAEDQKNKFKENIESVKNIFVGKKEAGKPAQTISMTEEDKKVLNSPEFKRASEATMDKKKGGMVKTKKYSKGGTASSRADGIATKGKTRGKIC
jgi:hypothetical protein